MNTQPAQDHYQQAHPPQEQLEIQQSLDRFFGCQDGVVSTADPQIYPPWSNQQSYGFLCGVLQFGDQTHRSELRDILLITDIDVKVDTMKESIGKFYDFYIRPFKQQNGSNSASPRITPASSRPGTPNGQRDDVSSEVLRHHAFRNSLVERDEVCLFCWQPLECHAAHIAAKKKLPFEYDEQGLLERMGITSKNQVQNGMFLCAICHGQFDKLQRYVETVEVDGDVLYYLVIIKGKLEEEEKWRKNLEAIAALRRVYMPDAYLNRAAFDDGDRLRLWFLKPFGDSHQMGTRSVSSRDSVDLRPKVEALAYHKTACLIWRMAAQGENDDVYFPEWDDDDCGNENVFSQQRTEEFVSSVVAALEDAAQQGRLSKEPLLETQVLEETTETI